ncbi:MAG: alpha/beta hydrolase [bacterium]
MQKKITKIILAVLAIPLVIIFFGYVCIQLFVESESPTLSAPTTTRFVQVGSEQVAYQMLDNHAPVTAVFVGGLAAWGGTWERTIQSASRADASFNYLVIDLPPFGYSTADASRGYFRDIQADRIEGVVENLGLSDVILVAHSYGAGPAAEYVMRRPAEVKKFVVIDGVLGIDEPKIVSKKGITQVDVVRNTLIAFLAHSSAFVQSRFKAFVYVTDHIDKDLIAVYMRSFNVDGTTAKLSRWFKDYLNDPLVYKSTDSREYKKLSIPVRLIWGDQDTVTPVSLSEVVLHSVPDVKMQTLKNIGHIPMIEDYDMFDRALLESLRR